MDYSDIEYRYSGGSSNSTPANSIGGVRSSVFVPELTIGTPSGSLGGVTIATAAGCKEGIAYLTGSSKQLAFTPPQGSQGPVFDCTGIGTAQIGLIGASGPDGGVLLLDIVEASMSTSSTINFTITRQKNKIWPDVTAAQAANGYTSYRCVYLTNTHGSQSITKLSMYVLNDFPSQATIYCAFDTDAGVGNGSTTGVAVAINTETDIDNDLGGLTFGNPTTEATALTFTTTTIGPGQSIPIWLKRVVPSGSTVDIEDDYFSFTIKAYVGV